MSEIQYRILRAIQNYTCAHGYAPSIRDLCQVVGISSASHLQYHLQALKDHGYVTRDPGIARSLRLLLPPPDRPGGNDEGCQHTAQVAQEKEGAG